MMWYANRLMRGQQLMMRKDAVEEPIHSVIHLSITNPTRRAKWPEYPLFDPQMPLSHEVGMFLIAFGVLIGSVVGALWLLSRFW